MLTAGHGKDLHLMNSISILDENLNLLPFVHDIYWVQLIHRASIIIKTKIRFVFYRHMFTDFIGN